MVSSPDSTFRSARPIPYVLPTSHSSTSQPIRPTNTHALGRATKEAKNYCHVADNSLPQHPVVTPLVSTPPPTEVIIVEPGCHHATSGQREWWSNPMHRTMIMNVLTRLRAQVDTQAMMNSAFPCNVSVGRIGSGRSGVANVKMFTLGYSVSTRLGFMH